MSSPLAPVPGWNEANAKLQQLLISDGLYSYLELTDNDPFMHQMLDNELYASFDLFCPYCKMVTTYQIKQGKATNSGTASRYVTGLLKPNVIVLNAVCLRINHLISVVLYRTEKRLIKIGQYPSMADLALGELKDVAKSLNPVDRKELGRALGLFAHDAPLGAFVYLRRVFERMILRAHGRHVAAGKPEVENFANLPMDVRIREIRDQLPPKVVQNSNVFGILSKGIHELSDEEGRDLFPLVKSVIFQMLGDEERLRVAAEQEATTDAALNRVIEQLGKKEKPALLEDQSGGEID